MAWCSIPAPSGLELEGVPAACCDSATQLTHLKIRYQLKTGQSSADTMEQAVDGATCCCASRYLGANNGGDRRKQWWCYRPVLEGALAESL